MSDTSCRYCDIKKRKRYDHTIEAGSPYLTVNSEDRHNTRKLPCSGVGLQRDRRRTGQPFASQKIKRRQRYDCTSQTDRERLGRREK